jgi:hypothetical protein
MSIKSRSRAAAVWDANLTFCGRRDLVAVVVALKRAPAGRPVQHHVLDLVVALSRPADRPQNGPVPGMSDDWRADQAAGGQDRLGMGRGRERLRATNWSRMGGAADRTGSFYSAP